MLKLFANIKEILKFSPLIPIRNLSKMEKKTKIEDNIVWIDMEMTGLDVLNDRILEIACLVTDKDLNILAEGPNLIINQPIELLNSMDEWCTKHHCETGLTNASIQSTISVEQAEAEVLNFIQQHTVKLKNPLAGNSIYMDRLFLRLQMPAIDSYLSYRIIDVSTCKELAKRWNPEMYWNAPKKRMVHRALDDIRESVAELQYYKQFMFLK